MPELPEVESLVQGLQVRLVGDVVREVHLGWPRIVATPAATEFAHDLPGHRFSHVGRRGKFVVMSLEPSGWLLVHLRMTGQLLWCGALEDPQPGWLDRHCHALIRLASGAVLVYRDVRKFGRLYLVDDPASVLGSLGWEPLADELTPQRLADLLRQRRTRIKPLLLDQRTLAGLGNIYVDESLWQAQLHPLRRADTLTDAEVLRLHTALRTVLASALGNGGTTLRDYRNACGAPGEHRPFLAVYGRPGEPCPRCAHLIERIVVGGRGTHFCPQCQQAPRQEG